MSNRVVIAQTEIAVCAITFFFSIVNSKVALKFIIILLCLYLYSYA